MTTTPGNVRSNLPGKPPVVDLDTWQAAREELLHTAVTTIRWQITQLGWETSPGTPKSDAGERQVASPPAQSRCCAETAQLRVPRQTNLNAIISPRAIQSSADYEAEPLTSVTVPAPMSATTHRGVRAGIATSTTHGRLPVPVRVTDNTSTLA